MWLFDPSSPCIAILTPYPPKPISTARSAISFQYLATYHMMTRISSLIPTEAEGPLILGGLFYAVSIQIVQ